jgi:hypothetical protein
MNGMMSGNSQSIAAIFNSLTQTIGTAEQAIPQQMQQIQSNASANNGMLDPMQMNQMQMLMQSYIALITMFSSIVKQVGDVEKQIASNIGG